MFSALLGCPDTFFSLFVFDFPFSFSIQAGRALKEGCLDKRWNARHVLERRIMWFPCENESLNMMSCWSRPRCLVAVVDSDEEISKLEHDVEETYGVIPELTALAPELLEQVPVAVAQ